MVIRKSAIAVAFAVSSVALVVAHAEAAPTTTVVDIPTRGVTQRFLYVRPDSPVANLVFLPGRDGVLGIEDDGSIPTIAGRCAPLARNRVAFASRGFALALVDQTSDGKAREFADVYEVVRYMRKRDNVPTWIVGGSGSTTGTLNFAVEFPADEPLGVVIFSPSQPDLSRAALVKRPTLIVYHQGEAVMLPRAVSLFDALSAAPVREPIGLTGGVVMNECGGYHLFSGIDNELVAAITGFIERHNTFPPSRPR